MGDILAPRSVRWYAKACMKVARSGGRNVSSSLRPPTTAATTTTSYVRSAMRSCLRLPESPDALTFGVIALLRPRTYVSEAHLNHLDFS